MNYDSMKYGLTEYTAFELSTIAESIDHGIQALEDFNKRCKDLGPDMEKLARERIANNLKKIAVLEEHRVHTLTAFQSVQRFEKAISN